jgi:hypothetical protein
MVIGGLMRALLAVVALAAVVLACSEAPTDPIAVNTDPSYATGFLGCQNQFTMGNIISVEAAEADANQDGAVCFLDVLEPGNSEVVNRTYTDNNVPNQLGNCPDSFTMMFAIAGTFEDRNGDGRLCVATRPNGNQVVIDNNAESSGGGK